MADNALFRKSALDKLASPERLDVLMQVTSPKGWLALLTIGIVLSIAVGWSILGSIPERVNGIGLLTHGEGNRQVRAGGTGRLSNLLVSVGQEVTAGEVIANIEAANVDDAVAIARSAYETARREAEIQETDNQVTRNDLVTQIADLEDERQRTEQDIEDKKVELEEREEQLRQRLIPRSRRDQVANELRALERLLVGSQRQIDNLNMNMRQIQAQNRNYSTEVDRLQQELDRVRNQASGVYNVTSIVAGRVVLLPTPIGEPVEPGDIIAVIEESEAPLQAVLFVSDTDGNRVHESGDPVQLDLSPTFRREEYGVLLGTVIERSSVPVLPEQVGNAYANHRQAYDVSETGAKFLVRVALNPDPATESGFEWSSSSGPSVALPGGMTVSSGAIIVESRRPVCKVLPVEFLCRRPGA